MNETATLGGGCFWCMEAALKQLDGIENAVSGYAGGHIGAPDYRSVCAGNTGHIEVVQFTFNPTQLDYRALLEAFFLIHDPTTRDRQGNDIGSQYRSVIFTHNARQETTAHTLIAELDRAQWWPAPIVTEVQPAPRFWPAETYHQNYFARNPEQGYCQLVVAPKVAKLRQQFAARLKP